MDQSSAETIAKIFGGDSWNSGGEIWLVLLRRSDGRVVAISDECVSVYEGEESLQTGQAGESIFWCKSTCEAQPAAMLH